MLLKGCHQILAASSLQIVYLRFEVSVAVLETGELQLEILDAALHTAVLQNEVVVQHSAPLALNPERVKLKDKTRRQSP
jgi:hypothetical protein